MTEPTGTDPCPACGQRKPPLYAQALAWGIVAAILIVLLSFAVGFASDRLAIF